MNEWLILLRSLSDRGNFALVKTDSVSVIKEIKRYIFQGKMWKFGLIIEYCVFHHHNLFSLMYQDYHQFCYNSSFDQLMILNERLFSSETVLYKQSHSWSPIMICNYLILHLKKLEQFNQILWMWYLQVLIAKARVLTIQLFWSTLWPLDDPLWML